MGREGLREGVERSSKVVGMDELGCSGKERTEKEWEVKQSGSGKGGRAMMWWLPEFRPALYDGS